MTQIGGYQIISRIAQGGMATVYLAKHPERVEWVALKVLSARAQGDPEFLARFEREAHIISTLSHPHIVPVYDAGVDQGVHYIAMAYLNYGSLRDRLDRFANRHEPMAVLEVLEVGRQIALALDYAHKRGIIHRDVKPNNILLAPGGRYVLSDFGVVFVQGASKITRDPRQMLGTAEYMSPEQAEQKQIDLRVDIYALGVVLYELLTGSVPFSNDTDMLVLFAHINQLPKPISQLRPDVPRDVIQIVERALCKQPAGRFDTAGALVLAIEQAMAAIAGLDTKSTRPVWEIGVAALVVLTLAAVGIRMGNGYWSIRAADDKQGSPTVLAHGPKQIVPQIALGQVIYVARATNAAFLNQPVRNARVLHLLALGTRLQVLGRTPDGLWLRVTLNDELGWVLRATGQIEGQLDAVPHIPALPKRLSLE